jgi:hypothetical protein
LLLAFCLPDVFCNPEDRGSKFHRNVGNQLHGITYQKIVLSQSPL